MNISIHALREEGDCGISVSLTIRSRTFQSTPSARRATLLGLTPDGIFGISIHALREEGDYGQAQCSELRLISIHALREEGDQMRDTKRR